MLVYDSECLQCEYHSDLKPATFANKRGYVEKWGKNDIVYNSEVFEADSRLKAKEGLALTNGVQYINAYAVLALIRLGEFIRAWSVPEPVADASAINSIHKCQEPDRPGDLDQLLF